ncbi:MAG: adenine deaminase [Desulfobacterales bacterium]|uniref:Adenine deaminase n=1 Tax=Candidatus Desulfaltia bathyphila TaxID=2841697 RepID=A0A8J6TAU8_9BACT|nr:adenine deaminase [Candidatus Desulfaltia bathyphila]MBL7194822.1 adenine deaminase [Desulfobacterales bacterium]MBL7206946.1 adenine deaminase [Desulfobacterales bacterium]
MTLDEMIKSARGVKEADILLTNVRIIDVFSGEIVDGDIAIAGGYIVGFGSYPAKRTVDMENRFVSPGFIDAHVHIESSMTCITEFARAIIPFGTTTVFADPHEIANVLGADGINYMLQSSMQQPMNIYFTLSSCVPATNMETSGARLGADDLFPFMGNDRIVALAEMMNYPGVIHRNPEVLRKIELAKAHGKPVDGHAPGLTGKDLYAYVAAGISSDHECTTAKEAKEKLNAGMHIMIREGTGAKNLSSLIPIVNEKSSSRIMWCTDDRHPHDILEEGHIDSMVRKAIHRGIDPVIAIQMATINPADYFGISDIGAISPGRRADLVVFSDLHRPRIEEVYYGGVLVAQEGKMSPEIKKPEPVAFQPSMNIGNKEIDFSIPAQAKHLRVIEVVPDQVITNQSIVEAAVSDNKVVASIIRDILKIAVVERHTGSGNIGKGFVRGFGLKRGALSSSVAHDSHNIIVVGTNDEDMKAAVKAVVKMGGGLAASCDSKICATLPLPIAGLMSQEPVYTVREKLEKLLEVARDFGTILNDPFMALSFLSLPVIPELKITDKGLVDVKRFCMAPLFVG